MKSDRLRSVLGQAHRRALAFNTKAGIESGQSALNGYIFILELRW